MISAEVSGARCEVPVPPGEPVPAAVVPNDGDLTYAEISFDPATLEALAEAAMNTGDPLTEAVCWNAAWRQRRVAAPAQRALAAGFAASAHTGDQLAQARAWLDGEGPRPDGLDLDSDLRGRLLRTLAARGLATDEDLDALAAADPVGGERYRAACLAARPDAAAKEAAWELALGGGDRRVTEAAASALWVPGQEGLLAAYRDRYFAEALPAAGPDWTSAQMRRLARALYPVTLAEPATLAATAAALESADGAEASAGCGWCCGSRRRSWSRRWPPGHSRGAGREPPIRRLRHSSRAAASAGTSTE